MCAGVQYKLDFEAYCNKAGTFTTTIGDHTVSSSAFTSHYNWVAQGPYTHPVFNTGDAGTSHGDNHFLDVGLTISISFSSGTIDIAAIYDVSIHPV